MKKLLSGVVLVFSMFLLVGCFFNNDDLSLFNSGLVAVRKDNKWGYINNKGKIIIDLKYDEAYAFRDGHALVVLGSKSMIIDKKGSPVIDNDDYELYRDYETGLVIFIEDEKYGLMDLKGEVLSKKAYDDITAFSEGLAFVKLDDKYGIINNKGEIIVEPIYDDCHSFSQGLAAVEKEDKWGYIDKNGETKIEFLFDSASKFDEYGRARVYNSEANKYQLIDSTGKKLIESSNIRAHGGPLYAALENDNYYIYDYNGKKVSTKAFSQVYQIEKYFMNLRELDGENLNIWFTEKGLIYHSAKSSESNYMSTKYREFGFEVPEDYFIHNKEGDLIQVITKDNMFNLTGDDVTQYISKEKFIVKRNDRYGIINKDEKVLVDFLYDQLVKLTDDYFLYSIHSKIGILNSKYKIVINAEYDNIEFFDIGI